MATPGKGETKPAAKKTTSAAPVEEPKKSEESTALTTTAPAALAKTDEIDLAADALAHQDHYDRSSIQIPFFQIIQSNSPQLIPQDAKYIDEAKQGDCLNTVSNVVYRTTKTPVEVIPCYHYGTFIEWRLREKGGGFIKDWGLAGGEAIVGKTHKDEKGRDIMPNNPENHLVRTEVYFLIVVNKDKSLDSVMLTMVSTQLKKARNWNSRMLGETVQVKEQRVKAPMFFNTYNLKTISESNAKGSWYGWVIENGQPTLNLGKEVYLAARGFRETMAKSVAEGKVNLAGAEENNKSGEATDEDAPF